MSGQVNLMETNVAEREFVNFTRTRHAGQRKAPATRLVRFGSPADNQEIGDQIADLPVDRVAPD
ncbi:MAG: hypothetical protein O3B04_07510 [Chloroflexi bacterium]|nr:hypothetical protein [Chloroflexota bacterium]